MNYQELYNTIESKLIGVSEFYSNIFKFATTIYLITLGLKTAYYNDESKKIPEKIKTLDFIKYVEFPNKLNGRNFEFIVNKDFYEANVVLFTKLEKANTMKDIDILIGKILNYPCAGVINEIVSKKHIGINYNIQKDSTKGHLLAYTCPYDIKEKSVKEAKDYLKSIKKVLKFVNIKVSLEVTEQEGIKEIIKTEVSKRIEKGLKSKAEKPYLDLTNLNLSEEDNIIIPEHPSGKWGIINLNNNNFKVVKNLPASEEYYFRHNKIESVSLKNGNQLTLEHNNIKNIEDIDVKKFKRIYFMNNPFTSKYIAHRSINLQNVKENISKDNINYTTIIIPRGTVLFRSMTEPIELSYMFIGYDKDKNNNDTSRLSPDYKTFFHLHPMDIVRKSPFGKIRTFFILQNDVEVFLGFDPSKFDKDGITRNENLYDLESCEEDYDSKFGYTCLKPEYKEKNILGWFSNVSNIYVNSVKDINSNLNYISTYKNKSGYWISELVLYPRKNINNETITTKIDDFDENYMKTHLKDFNYKPFMIFDETVSREEYKEIFDKLLSVEGFTNEDGTFHITVNKIDGTYVLAEDANEDILKDCVPVTKDRVEYLKEYISSQK